MRSPDHAENRNIKTAGSRPATFEKNEHGQGAGANVVDGRDSWRVDLGADALVP